MTGGTNVTDSALSIVTSNRSYRTDGNGTSVVTTLNNKNSSMCDMDTADTATFTIQIFDTGGKIDYLVGSTSPFCWASGALIC